MDTREVTIVLPGDVAREAEGVGLLETEAIIALLREEIRRRRSDRFFEIADCFAALDEPLLTQEEVKAEIKAVREARRAQHASGS